jgi:hypothetical protein
MMIGMFIGLVLMTLGFWIAFLGARHRFVVRHRQISEHVKPRARPASTANRV